LVSDCIFWGRERKGDHGLGGWKCVFWTNGRGGYGIGKGRNVDERWILHEGSGTRGLFERPSVF
jgi:hypothetical protein